MKVPTVRKVMIFIVLALTFSIGNLQNIALAENENPVLFSNNFTVTNEGGKFQVGFVEVDFKKGSLPEGTCSITFNAQIYAENGVVYIEFSPDAVFKKDVHLKCLGYEGYIYDRSAGINIYVSVKKTALKNRSFFSIYLGKIIPLSS